MNIFKKIIFVNLLFVFFTSTAFAHDMTGRSWLESSGKYNDLEWAHKGFLQGFLEGNRTAHAVVRKFLIEGQLKLVQDPKLGYAGSLHKLDFFLLQCMSDKSFGDLFKNDIDSTIKANPELLDESLEEAILQTIF